ncbi:MAG: hypothetical protein V3W41_07370 [Planctomycetota bacterium]
MRLQWVMLAGAWFLLFASAGISAQNENVKHVALAGMVEEYFAASSDAAADACLNKILSSAPDPAKLLALVKKRPTELPSTMEFSISHQGSTLLVGISVPKGHDFQAKALPVVFDPASDGKRWLLVPAIPVIKVAIAKFEPPPSEFTDLGRDAYLRVLRMAAWRANGDLEQLWFTGFSWAAHASYDTALHRPDTLRGILPLGGGPRRVHFRLMPNLAGTRILSLCGGRDDRELIWNLKEVDRIKKRHAIDYQVIIDPDKGHRSDLAGRELAAALISNSKHRAPWPRKGRLLADMPRVENRWLRIDAVDSRKVQAPRRIPVSMSLSRDQKRRVTIKKMNKYVARLDWLHNGGGKAPVRITLKAKAVQKAPVFLRASMVAPGRPISIQTRSTKFRKRALEIDPRVLLTEARRLGDRIDPVIAKVEVRF